MPVEAGDVLFEIDPVPYQALVDEIAARLSLARLRFQQYKELAEQSAGSRFQLEQAQYDVEQLQAQLVSAEFNLANTSVRASNPGIVQGIFSRPVARSSQGRSVMTFVDTNHLVIAGLFQQKALQNVLQGDRVLVNFPALPGRVFEAEVVAVPSAIGDAQVLASGQLPSVQQQRMTPSLPRLHFNPRGLPIRAQQSGPRRHGLHTHGRRRGSRHRRRDPAMGGHFTGRNSLGMV